MTSTRRFTNNQLAEMAAMREDWCPPHEEYLRLIAQAREANALREGCRASQKPQRQQEMLK